MRLRLPAPCVWLFALVLVGPLAFNDALATGSPTSIPGDNVTVDHGDPPVGGGGFDGIDPHPGSGSGASTPKGTTLRGRAKAKLSGNPSTHPQP